MQRQKIYHFIIVVFVVLFTACGTDSKENPSGTASSGPYGFFNATTPLTIMAPIVDVNGTIIGGGNYQIKVQLLEHGFSKSGEIVQMKPFDRNYGFVTNEIVLTNNNGDAVFEYNYPDDYAKIRGQNITVEAIFFDPAQVIFDNPYGDPIKRKVLLTQEFVLQFR